MGRLYIIFSIVLLYLITGCGGGTKSTDITQIDSKDITIKYGNSAQIIFDWYKSGDTTESIYISSQEQIDDSASLLLSKSNKEHYMIECIPKEQSDNEIIYICDGNITMKLARTKLNYILLDKRPVGSIKIVQTEDRIEI